MSIYFDYNASAPVRPAALAAMLPHFLELHGNPSSVHAFGQRARAAVENARAEVSALVGAEPGEVIFCSGGTEANNMVLRGVAAGCPGAIIITAVEHAAIYNTALKMRAGGRTVHICPVDSRGVMRLDALTELLTAGPVALVSIMTANNETGVLQPVREAADLCRAQGILVHSDAAQAVGKVPVNMTTLGVDYLTVAAHKLGGPIGIGALVVRSGAPMERLMEGASHELNRRPGTPSSALAAGFGAACGVARHILAEEMVRIGALRDRLETAILAGVPGAAVNGAGAERLPNTTNISFPGVRSDLMVMRLDLEGFAVSSGSACHSGRTEPSRVIAAAGLGEERATTSIRFSLGPDTKMEEVDALAGTVIRVVPEIATVSQ
jgi:cysteine desulfurase